MAKKEHKSTPSGKKTYLPESKCKTLKPHVTVEQHIVHNGIILHTHLEGHCIGFTPVLQFQRDWKIYEIYQN